MDLAGFNIQGFRPNIKEFIFRPTATQQLQYPQEDVQFRHQEDPKDFSQSFIVKPVTEKLFGYDKGQGANPGDHPENNRVVSIVFLFKRYLIIISSGASSCELLDSLANYVHHPHVRSYLHDGSLLVEGLMLLAIQVLLIPTYSVGSSVRCQLEFSRTSRHGDYLLGLEMTLGTTGSRQ